MKGPSRGACGVFAGTGRLAAGLLFAVMLWLSARNGHAQVLTQDPATTLAVSAPPCIERPYDRARLLELLRVELSALGLTGVTLVPPSGAPSSATLPFPATVTLGPDTCQIEATEVSIRIVDRASAKAIERRMTIGDVPLPERPRALAIGIAELMQASWAELALSPRGPPPELPPSVRAALVSRTAQARDVARTEADARMGAWLSTREREERARAAAADARRRAPLLEASVLTRTFPSRGTALLGAGGAARFRWGESGTLHVGLDGAFGDSEVREGSVTVGASTVSIGSGFVVGDSTELEIGPRLHAGYGWASGSAETRAVRGQSYGNVLVLALATATLRLPIGSPWIATAGLDLGHTLAGVAFLSDTSRVAGVEGVVLGFRVGVGTGL